VELRKSDIHGIGVFVTADLPKDANPFPINGPNNGETLHLTNAFVEALPEQAQVLIKKFYLRDEDGTIPVPKSGLVSGLGISFYCNSANSITKDGVQRSIGNLEVNATLDHTGYTEMYTTRRIAKDKELLLTYTVEMSARTTGTIDSSESKKVTKFPCEVALLTECYICQDPLNDDDSNVVVDKGCSCSNCKVHEEYALKWFKKKFTLSFTPAR